MIIYEAFFFIFPHLFTLLFILCGNEMNNQKYLALIMPIF